MQEKTNATLQLVSEVHAICAQLKVSYLPGGLLLRGIAQNTNYEFPQVDLYVNDDDLPKLAEALEQSEKPMREVKRGDAACRYINSATTYIDLKRAGVPEVSGIRVDILPCSSIGVTSAMLGDCMTTFYYGYEVNAPRDAEALCDAVFGAGDDRTYPSFPEATTMISAILPYADVLSELEGAEQLDAAISQSLSHIAELDVIINEENADIEKDLEKMRALYGL